MANNLIRFNSGTQQGGGTYEKSSHNANQGALNLRPTQLN